MTASVRAPKPVANRRSDHARGRRRHVGTSDSKKGDGGPMRTRCAYTRKNINISRRVSRKLLL